MDTRRSPRVFLRDSGLGACGVGEEESRSGGRGISRSITSGEEWRLDDAESDFWLDLLGAYPALETSEHMVQRRRVVTLSDRVFLTPRNSVVNARFYLMLDTLRVWGYLVLER